MEKLEKIKEAIKAQKWTKSSFVYAMDAMFPYRFWDEYRLTDLKERFYKAVTQDENFRKIKNFTTFRNINF